MECPHLQDNVKLTSELLQDTISNTKDLKCAECDVSEQLWMCLYCGVISCSRYHNAHGVSHATTNSHPACISCEQHSVYCYECDDYTVNDSDSIEICNIRQILIKLEDCSESYALPPDIDRLPEIESASMGDSLNNTTPIDSSPVRRRTMTPVYNNNGTLSPAMKNSPRRRSPNSASNGTENVEPDCDQNLWKTLKAPEDGVRSLRPRSRKRSHSEDSTSTDNSSSSNSSGVPFKKTNPNSPVANGKIENGKTERREKKVVGLRNLGNTCFMNAVLQSLSNIQEFSCYFNSLPSLEGKGNSKRVYHSRSYKEVQDVVMAEELRKVLINLNAGGCGTKGAISPECLFLVIWKVVPRFRGYQQQDAHEFLRYMLDRLHTELLQLLPPDVGLKDNAYLSLAQRGRSSIVTAVFGGMLQSEVRCLACGTESKKNDPFLDLSLDIPERLISCNSSSSRKSSSMQEEGNGSPPSPECSILDCLQSFVEIEELADTELYFCSTCKSKQRSTKQFWIRRLPNVLCLHIKRFRWNNFFRTKIDIDISFPTTALDMSDFVLNNAPETRRSGSGCNLYDLAAVIVHHGSGAGSGHYTAFAINDGQWFHFNDSSVRPIDVNTVASCKPYILFYIRRVISLPNHSTGSNSSQQRTFDIAVEQPVEDS